ncbi:hypothetical protein RJ639_008421 [Escallonia herrerae]|uniref:GST C-terminal domain-containing protein n=1 Tax=Escallonia herrerae TaxID=1293975 RepID=A0AA89ATB4_9ASTE|nr:hypothetical protein RJ639_008421 [Escallonia herrerae]
MSENGDNTLLCVLSIWKAFSTKEEKEKPIEEAYENLKLLEKELSGKRFFGGDSLGIVDICANFIGFWLGVVQEVTGLEFLTKGMFPNLSVWFDEFLGCSIVKESLPPREKLLRFFRARYGPTNPYT